MRSEYYRGSNYEEFSLSVLRGEALLVIVLSEKQLTR